MRLCCTTGDVARPAVIPRVMEALGLLGGQYGKREASNLLYILPEVGGHFLFQPTLI